MRTLGYVAAGFLALTGQARAAAPEIIGSWVLSCPADAACVMRASKRFLDKGGISGDLEVQAEGKLLVPVVTLRGLPDEVLMAAAMAGEAEASLQYSGGSRQKLDCTATKIGIVCSPKDDAAKLLAAGLPLAHAATVRVVMTVTRTSALPAQEKAVDLSQTSAALSRLRAVGPAQVPTSMAAEAVQSPASLMGMADKMLKAAGYHSSAAQLDALIAKYKGGSR